MSRIGQFLGRRDALPPFPHGSYRAGSLRGSVAFARGRWRWLWSAALGVVLELLPDFLEEVLVGAGAGEVDEDTARTNFYLRANFEEFEADGTAGGFGQTRALKSDTAQGVYQGIGSGGKP